MNRALLLDRAVVVASVLIVVAVVIDLVTILTGHVSSDAISDLAVAPAFVVLALMAPPIVRRRAGNPIGTLFAALVLTTAPNLLADTYAVLVADSGSGSRPYDHVAAWFSNWAWVVPVSLLVCELPLRFPDGALPSPRWRWAERVVLVQTVTLSLGLALMPGGLDSYPINNPLGVESARAVFLGLDVIGTVLFLVCAVQGVVAIVRRFHGASGLERQQLKMLAAGFLGATLALLLAVVVRSVFQVGGLGVAIAAAAACVVLSAGLAVLRYRLYDIDRLITRTLSWVALTVVLGLAYAALVLAGQAVFSSFAGGSNFAIAVSTLVVAALFLPLRSRVQRVVDRRFYRRRYDAQRTLDAFGARLREQVELDGLQSDLQGVVAESMQPAHVSVWLRSEKTVTIP